MGDVITDVFHSRFSIPVVTVLVPAGLSSWRSLALLPDYKSKKFIASIELSIIPYLFRLSLSLSLSLPPPCFSENLVRAGFQSLQLVITDFLPSIPPSCVPSCVEVGGQYGLQTMDINISLTSIGILVCKNLVIIIKFCTFFHFSSIFLIWRIQCTKNL